MACKVTETPEVDGADLLDEHPSHGAVDIDLGPERCGLCAGRCRRDEHDGAWQERIGLHNDAESTSLLLMTRSIRETQGEDVTSTHGGLP